MFNRLVPCNNPLLPAQDALSEANIEPSERPIQTSNVVAAMKRKFGVAPILHCSKGGGREFLSEVSCARGAGLAGQVCVLTRPPGGQVYMCVNMDFEVVDCKDVCVRHHCVPSPDEPQQDFCGEELIFKVPGGDMQLATAADDEQCKLCKPKSGTCKPTGGHGSTLQGSVIE